MDTPHCKHLRTKSMFVDATPEEAFAEKEGEFVTPCHFWCNRTQTAIGMDGQPVHKNTCHSPRSCCEE